MKAPILVVSAIFQGINLQVLNFVVPLQHK